MSLESYQASEPDYLILIQAETAGCTNRQDGPRPEFTQQLSVMSAEYETCRQLYLLRDNYARYGLNLRTEEVC